MEILVYVLIGISMVPVSVLLSCYFAQLRAERHGKDQKIWKPR